MTGLEAVIVYEFWDRCRLVSPVSMHKHYGIGHLDYDGRKDAVVEIAVPHLRHLSGFTSQVRQHDMADALLMVMFHVDTTLRPAKRRKATSLLAPAVDLQRFAFAPRQVDT